jgi:O-succinylbenzoate synthase
VNFDVNSVRAAIEQPLNWDEIYAHAKLQAQIKTAICLDECITNARHAATAIELEACRIISSWDE